MARRNNKAFIKKLYLPDSKLKGQNDKMSRVTASATELNLIDGVTATTAEINTACDISAFKAATLQSAEHGAGAVSTAFAPRTYRWTDGLGHITTEIHVDITGFGCHGSHAKDVICLPGATTAGYIGKYVTANYGTIYKLEIICVEAPTQATATITQDIDLGSEDGADLGYNEVCDDVVINTATLIVGETALAANPNVMPANDYIYLIEGDTAATTGVYSGGQFIIRAYGHAVIT